MVDYNVTCPDFRFCQVRHTYESPCEIWDCDACWWNFPNCTKTPTPASEQCPYIYKCSDLPHPNSHVATAVVTTVSIISVLAFGAGYIYRRYRRSQQVADSERQEEGEEESERVPLLQRCRALVTASMPSLGQEDENTDNAGVFNRFRSVIFGRRANLAPPEVPHPLHGGDEGDTDNAEHEPSAPSEDLQGHAQQQDAPPPYDTIDRDPIIRGNRSLANENYSGSRARSVEMREISSRPAPSAPPCMEEIPLSQSLR